MRHVVGSETYARVRLAVDCPGADAVVTLERGKPRHQADASFENVLVSVLCHELLRKGEVGSLSVVVFWIWVGLPYPSP